MLLYRVSIKNSSILNQNLSEYIYKYDDITYISLKYFFSPTESVYFSHCKRAVKSEMALTLYHASWARK